MTKGGALSFYSIDTIEIKDSNISENKAFYKGGAIHVENILVFKIEKSSFKSNLVYLDKTLT